MDYKNLKLQLRVFLADHTVAMVIYCVTKMTTTCSRMFKQFCKIMIVAIDIDCILCEKEIFFGSIVLRVTRKVTKITWGEFFLFPFALKC